MQKWPDVQREIHHEATDLDYPHSLPGYPRRLHEAGYETAYICKWHMGEDDDQQRPGFDFWMSHKGQGNYWDNEFNINGQRRVLKGYYTTVVTDAAIEWLQGEHERPWLLVLGHKAPHGGPIVPEPKYEHAFDQQKVVPPANAAGYRVSDGKPAWLERSYPTWHGLGGPLYGQKEYGKFVRAYLGCIASVDDSMGRIYEALRASGQLETQNLISIAAHAQRVRDLAAELRRLMQQHHALPDKPPLDEGIKDLLPKF